MRSCVFGYDVAEIAETDFVSDRIEAVTFRPDEAICELVGPVKLRLVQALLEFRLQYQHDHRRAAAAPGRDLGDLGPRDGPIGNPGVGDALRPDFDRLPWVLDQTDGAVDP